MEYHELANVFPYLKGAEFERLKESIKEDGLQVPIVLYEGKILDGRNRHRACQAVEVKPKYDTYTGDDPGRFVLALNVARRHLTEAQAAMAAAKIANIKWGSNRFEQSVESHACDSIKTAVEPISQTEAAQLLGVGRSTVTEAARIRREAAPEVVKAVEEGNLSIKSALSLAKLPHEKQKEVIKAGPTAIQTAVKAIREIPKVRPAAVQERQAILTTLPMFLNFAEQAQRVPRGDLMQDMQADLDQADEDLLDRLGMSRSGFEDICSIAKLLKERGCI